MAKRLRAIWDDRSVRKSLVKLQAELEDFEILSLHGLRSGARGPPGKLQRATAHNGDLTKRPREPNRVKIPEHGDVERSSTEVLTQKTSPRAKNREIRVKDAWDVAGKRGDGHALA